jgi:6-phosphogluconolactonase (cycloisomerase 2 family)
LYINYENKGAVTQFRVDGPEYIRRIEDVNLLPPGSELTPQDNQSELLISPDGKFLYDFVRGQGLAVVLSIDQQTGKPDVIQRLQLGGPDPRGAAWSPDKRFILVAGHDSMETETLEIGEDGLLVFTGRTCKMPHPAFISFYPSEK